MSNSNDVNEQSGSPRDSRNPGNTSGMTCNSPVPVAIPAIQRQKDVLQRNVSNSADASLATAADNGGPRNRVGQFDKPSTGAPAKFGSGSGESEYEGAGA